ncbi:hypothetical protein ACMX25_11995 [Caballeronia sp. 15715]|uniref:hypothetical protein n=1 Tax=Caballeronia sp. 15715 TaxID=3391030 RepID=UPI0039E65D6E
MTHNETPLIVGRADPFATVDVYDSATLLGVAVANGQGAWPLQLSTPLFDGIHDLSAVQATDYGTGRVATYFAVTVEASERVQATFEESVAPTDAIRVFDAAREPGQAYFPPNYFTVRSTEASAEVEAGAAKNDRSVPPDPPPPANAEAAIDSQAYVRQALTGVAGGKSFDTVAFLGHHLALDLNGFAFALPVAYAPNIGGFDLGGHHNALTLSLADVLSLGGHNLFVDDGKRQVIVNGKAGDSVDLTNSHVTGLSERAWQQHGAAHVGGGTYNVVEHSSANTELLVQQAFTSRSITKQSADFLLKGTSNGYWH